MAPRSFILAIVVMFLMTAIWPSAMASAGQPMPLKPTLSISPLDPPEVTIEAAPTSTSSGIFHATVTVDKPPAIGTVMVSLDATTSTDWTTTVDPATIPFTSPGSVQITVRVTVPPETLSSSVGMVTVTGIGTYPGYSTPPASSTGTVKIKQYYRCLLNITPTLGIDNPQTYKIIVTNNGNGNDSFELNIPLQQVLTKVGLSVAFDRTTTEKIPQHSTATINMTVSYGPSAASGKKEIYVRSTSKASMSSGNGTVYTDAMTTIDVQPWHGSSGISLGVIALVIVIIVVVVILIAKKKGKLKFGRKPKPAPAEVKGDTKVQKEK